MILNKRKKPNTKYLLIDAYCNKKCRHCNQTAIFYKFPVHGKDIYYSCSEFKEQCPGIKAKRLAGKQKVDPVSGLTCQHLASIKTHNTKLNTIDKETGLNLYEKWSKDITTFNQTINPETGISFHVEQGLKNARKRKEDVDLESGLDAYARAILVRKENDQKDPARLKNRGQKTKEILSKVDPISGLTGYQKQQQTRDKNMAELAPFEKSEIYKLRAKKGKITKQEVIEFEGKLMTKAEASQIKIYRSLYEIRGDDGKTAYERSKNSRFILQEYYDTGILYQCSYEKNFLDELSFEYSLDWISKHVFRPKSITYFCPIKQKNRTYHPDFIVNYGGVTKILYEIKSSWTLNKLGDDLDLQKINIEKVKTASQKLDCKAGYLVVDGFWCPIYGSSLD